MNIFITLDYELFLGNPVGSLDNCIIKPIMAISSVLKKSNTKMTIFVDGAYLVRLEYLSHNNIQLRNDFEEVLSNIQILSSNGHSIQYHFHPQWLYSDFRDNKWYINDKYYSLSDLPDEVREFSFKRGIDIIESIIKKKVFAFRAGGYTLGDYTVYSPLFVNNGITVDSSVRFGTYSVGRFQRYDYRSAPQKSMYKFKNSVCLEEVDGFTELPISMSKKESSILYLLRKRRLMKQYRPHLIYGDGKSVDALLTSKQRLNILVRKFFSRMSTSASIDGISSLDLCRLYKWYKTRNYDNFVIIGHPKLATDVSIRELESFVDLALSNGDNFCIVDDIV